MSTIPELSFLKKRVNYWCMYNNMDESQKHQAEWKKPDTKDYMLFDFNLYKTLGKNNLTHNNRKQKDCL